MLLSEMLGLWIVSSVSIYLVCFVGSVFVQLWLSMFFLFFFFVFVFVFFFFQIQCTYFVTHYFSTGSEISFYLFTLSLCVLLFQYYLLLSMLLFSLSLFCQLFCQYLECAQLLLHDHLSFNLSREQGINEYSFVSLSYINTSWKHLKVYVLSFQKCSCESGFHLQYFDLSLSLQF